MRKANLKEVPNPGGMLQALQNDARTQASKSANPSKARDEIRFGQLNFPADAEVGREAQRAADVSQRSCRALQRSHCLGYPVSFSCLHLL